MPGAFQYCYNLEKLVIPETVTRIDLGSSTYTGSDMDIRFNTFGDVPLKKLQIKGHLNENLLVNDSFMGRNNHDDSWCPQLEELELERRISQELINCPKLKTLILNFDIDDMYGIVKQKISELNELRLLMHSSLTPPSADENTFSKSQYMDLIVVVPDEAVETYKKAEVWRNFWNIISKSDYLAGSRVAYTPNNEKVEVARYDCSGNIVNSDFSGIVIIRYSDGSTRKIIQK